MILEAAMPMIRSKKASSVRERSRKATGTAGVMPGGHIGVANAEAASDAALEAMFAEIDRCLDASEQRTRRLLTTRD